jgi:S1-C subfamily serine protease
VFLPFAVAAIFAVMVCLLAQTNPSLPIVRQVREMIFGQRLSGAADQAWQLARTLAPTGAGSRGAEPSPSQPDGPASQPLPPAETDNLLRQPAAPEPPAPASAPADRLPQVEPPPPITSPPTPRAVVRVPATPPPARPPASRPPAQTGRVRSSGTAFFITDDGYLLTSRHVVASANRVVIRTKRGEFPAQVIRSSSDYDVALLKATGTFKALPLANSQGVSLGNAVFTIGFPIPNIQGVEPKYTRGEINSLAGIQDDPRFFQMSVAIQPGNSGGPLVTLSGNTVGIIAMRLDDREIMNAVGSLPQNVNYAVKSSFILTFLRSVPGGVVAKLKPAQIAGNRRSEDVVKEVEEAVGLVLVY